MVVSLPNTLLSRSSRFEDESVHSWYTSVMAFPDHLVKSLLNYFSPRKGDIFFDPYCGSGTSLVEAQRYGLHAYGIDANPSSVLASRVKTNWRVKLLRLERTINALVTNSESIDASTRDPILRYLHDSGMIERGWIDAASASQAVAIRRWIDLNVIDKAIRDILLLALLATVVNDLASVKFGPELYCVPKTERELGSIELMLRRLRLMLAQLRSASVPTGRGQTRLGDARDARSLRTAAEWQSGPVCVVTSPPYPTDHDYTRLARLELVFMEAVVDSASLRRIKKRMLRSHSKGIYVGDRDAEAVLEFSPVQSIRAEIEDRLGRNHSGFEGQYSKVITNYFGGMLRHFRAMSRYLPRGSNLGML